MGQPDGITTAHSAVRIDPFSTHVWLHEKVDVCPVHVACNVPYTEVAAE